MNTISRKRFKEENLEFTEVIDSDDGKVQKVRYIVIDHDGTEYDGVLDEDGSLDDGFTVWQSPEICERFGRHTGSAKPIAKKYLSRWRAESLFFNDTTCELFLLIEYSSAGMHYMDAISLLEAALWFVDLECDQELTISNKPFIGCTLPNEMMDRVLEKARAEFESRVSWLRMLFEKALETDANVVEPDIEQCSQSDEITSILARIRGKRRDIEEAAFAGEDVPPSPSAN